MPRNLLLVERLHDEFAGACASPPRRSLTLPIRLRRSRLTISMTAKRRFFALVAGLGAGALDRLFDGVDGQDAVADRNAVFLLQRQRCL